MKNQDVIIQNVGSVELFNTGRQDLHPTDTLPVIKDLFLGDYFNEGIHFHFVDKRLYEWFDPIVQESPGISFQQYIVKNDMSTDRKKKYPYARDYGRLPEREANHVMSQSEFLDFAQKHGLYQEFTLAHFAQITHFPNFYSGHLSSYGGNDTFLMRKKTGELCWAVFDMTEQELYEHERDDFRFLLYDFEPNSGIPGYYVNLKANQSLFCEKIK